MITFAAGAIIYQWRDAMPARWSLVALCTAITIAAGIWLPSYLVVAGLPLAYAVIVSGILLKHRRLNLRNDISYGAYIYAFPTQQLLASWGLFTLAPLAFFAISTAATFPLAVASWFLIERRAIALKGRMRMRRGVNSQESDLDGNAAEYRDIKHTNEIGGPSR
jgi:peptidoglycan/LPS O-acetylase OafA/YrhL